MIEHFYDNLLRSLLIPSKQVNNKTRQTFLHSTVGRSHDVTFAGLKFHSERTPLVTSPLLGILCYFDSFDCSSKSILGSRTMKLGFENVPVLQCPGTLKGMRH